jgi:holin-like protein
MMSSPGLALGDNAAQETDATVLHTRVQSGLRSRTTVWLRRNVCPCVGIAAQIAALAALNYAGYAIAGVLRVALPGNLVGMLLLLALLASGAVRLEWIERTTSFLLRHLAFFFIPIAVGIMGFGELMRASGLALLLILLASSLVGIWAAGTSVQRLSHESRS